MRNFDFDFNKNQQNPVYQETQEQILGNIQQQPFYQQQNHSQLLQNNQEYYGAALNSSQGEAVTAVRQSLQHAKSRQRTGMKSGTVGEIVQVQGGHIVRSIGRKDRHSKVCTAKGPRDRRVRLSAHTAIEFYDVQDRLGYDRPSKAVDWLIKKAKSAIDKLAQLPPWHPTSNEEAIKKTEDQNVEESSHIEMPVVEESESPPPGPYNFHLHKNNDSSFITPTMHPNEIPDNIRSLFSTSSTNHSEDLGLSLQSFQYQGLIHGRSQAGSSHTPSNELSGGSAQVGFESDLMGWNNSSSSSSRGGGGFSFNPLPVPVPLQQVMLSHEDSALISQRGSLQSNYSQTIRAWNDLTIHQPFIFGSRFASDNGFLGFSSIIPSAQINREEEDRPSSSSPHSQH